MAMKTMFLAVAFLALLISEPAWCAVGDPCPKGDTNCGATEKCDKGTTECVARVACVPADDCNGHGTCDVTDHSCTCETGYTGTDCSGTCGGAPCTGTQVCVGPDASKTCVEDPCKDGHCGTNGACKYDEKVAAPKPVCTCKNGYGGDTCTAAPECQSSTECKDEAKPECKKEDGKQSVCAEKNAGNIVAAAPGIILAVILSAFYL